MRSRAVTLIEVLVALVLAALLTVAVQSLVVHAYRTARTLQAQRDAESTLEVPLVLLRQDLECMALANAIELRDGVLRISTLNDLTPETSAARHALDVHYRLNGHAPATELVREQAEVGGSEPPQTQVVSRSVARLAFEVYDGSAWCTSWPPSNPRTLLALRCKLTPHSGPTEELRITLQPLRWSSHAR